MEAVEAIEPIGMDKSLLKSLTNKEGDNDHKEHKEKPKPKKLELSLIKEIRDVPDSEENEELELTDNKSSSDDDENKNKENESVKRIFEVDRETHNKIIEEEQECSISEDEKKEEKKEETIEENTKDLSKVEKVKSKSNKNQILVDLNKYTLDMEVMTNQLKFERIHKEKKEGIIKEQNEKIQNLEKELSNLNKKIDTLNKELLSQIPQNLVTVCIFINYIGKD